MAGRGAPASRKYITTVEVAPVVKGAAPAVKGDVNLFFIDGADCCAAD